MRQMALLALLCTACSSLAAPKKQHNEYELAQRELQSVKSVYETEQGVLRRTVDERWARRQEQVERKTALQQSVERTQAEIERLYSEIARIREEMLLRENSLHRTTAALEQAKQTYDGVSLVLKDVLRKEEDAARIAFPLGQRQRSLRVQELMRDAQNNSAVTPRSLAMLQRYVLDNLRRQATSEIVNETILLDDHSAREAPVVRLGTVLACGVDDSGTAYYLGYSAHNVAAPFEWVRLTDGDAARNLVGSMPRWMTAGAIDGELFVDVLQNAYSDQLLGIERKTAVSAVWDFVKAGGVVMIPLGLICLWAIVLFINRLIVYSMAHSRDNRFIDAAIEFLNQKNHGEAQAFARQSNGVLARILTTCLAHSKWKRPVAEKAVKELLLAEIPALDKYLDTLAVLAGAAPLLGLLGTVTGMIGMFEAITRFGTGDPKLLAGGISEALITTEVGLAIAIPVLLVHNFLRNRRNHIQADMEMYAMRILNRLWPED